jgi:hypothetical protein
MGFLKLVGSFLLSIIVFLGTAVGIYLHRRKG